MRCTISLGFLGAAAAVASAAPLPPASLVRLDAPPAAAIVRHEVAARLEPGSGRIEATDRFTVVHAPGVPAERALPFLLWHTLAPGAVTAADARGRPLEIAISAPQRVDPRAFWKRPPYDELSGYDLARQYTLAVEPAVPTWPETLVVTLTYAGTVVDSLKPPPEAYARSFEQTAGLIESRGVFLSAASFWIPSLPEDIFTFSLAATVPQGWRAVSQGGLVSPAEAARGDQTDRWECDQPMEEIYLCAGPWTLHEEEHRGVRCQTFTYADTDSSIYNRYLRGTGRYLDLYGDLIGPYPFPKFALVENFWQTGFGMPSFTLLGSTVIRLPFILDTSYGHEILHNWWGNGVFVKYEDGNWCEGLTVYQADYLYKEREGRDAARQYRLDALKGYLDYVSGGEDFPLRDFRQREDFATQAIGYSKSMMALHQLRREVGDVKWNASLRDFYRTNLWRRASWSDLLAAFERVTGKRFDWFREQWIDQAGAPEVSISDVLVNRKDHADPPGATSWTVHFKLDLGDSWEPSAAAPDSVRLPVVVDLEGGEELRLDALRLGPDRRSASIVTKKVPLALSVDPDFDFLRRLYRQEIPPTLSQTLGADTVNVVFASTLTKDQRAAWQPLVDGWVKSKTHVFYPLEERDLPAGFEPTHSTWLLGFGPLAEALLASEEEVQRPKDGQGWRFDQLEYPADAAVCVTGVVPNRPDLSWTLIEIPDPANVERVDRKIPHYGKYGWLAFVGVENKGKGIWKRTETPLRVELEVRP